MSMYNEIMFDKIGEKIKRLAVVIVWLGIISSLISSIVLFFLGLFEIEELWWLILLSPIVFFVGCFLSWLSVIFIYGFGELISDTHNINLSIKELKKTSDTVREREYKHDAYEKTVSYSQGEAKHEPEMRTKADAYDTTRSSLKIQKSSSQSQVYDVWTSPGSKADKEKVKVEDNSTPREKLINKIANLSVKRNLINPDDSEAKAKLTREIDSLKAELAAMPEE